MGRRRRVPVWLVVALVAALASGGYGVWMAMGQSTVTPPPPRSACELIRPEALARLGLTQDGPADSDVRHTAVYSECLWSAGTSAQLDIVVGHHSGDGQGVSPHDRAGWLLRAGHGGYAELTRPDIPGAEAVQLRYDSSVATPKLEGWEGGNRVELWMRAGAFSVLLYWTSKDEPEQAVRTAQWLAREVVSAL